MARFATWVTSSPRPPTTTDKRTPSDHTLAYAQRHTSIDGEHRTLTKGVLSALIVEGAFCHMGRIFTDASDYHR